MTLLQTWSRDSMSLRLAAMTLLVVLLTIALVSLFRFVGPFSGPPIERTGLTEECAAILRILDGAAPADRSAIAARASSDHMLVTVLDRVPLVPGDAHQVFDPSGEQSLRALLRDPERFMQIFRGPTAAVAIEPAMMESGQYYWVILPLRGAGWAVVTLAHKTWGLSLGERSVLFGLCLLVSIIAVSFLAQHWLARPIVQFTRGAARFGANPKAAAIPESGPREIRDAIRAFNTMQEQIQAFVAERIRMLAAISHDLRNPLTRIRLRGEFIGDADEQRKLFRDVDEMQEMIESSLAFFAGRAHEAQPTHFDLAELLRVIVDEHHELEQTATYAGPDHLIVSGHPNSLKRAFGNLVDNAIQYGGHAEIVLEGDTQRVVVTVTDSGPGIPERALKSVFAPFFRLETARSRTSGGVGLGLATVRAIVDAHGGLVELENQVIGLRARVMLPIRPSSGGRIPTRSALRTSAITRRAS
ncbi:MAG: sensor histidine kinase [Rhodospirillales bacterium]|nr:sensor histidine kinase [Rhodospirillales bacterium]